MARFVLPLAAFCVLFVSSVHASPATEYLELVSIEETIDEYGLIVFNGTIQSTHPTQTLVRVWVHITLKKDGKVIDVIRDLLGEDIDPGGSAAFSIETLFAEGE